MKLFDGVRLRDAIRRIPRLYIEDQLRHHIIGG